MRRRLACFGIALALALPSGVAAYLKIGVQVGTQVVGLQWKSFPVRYFITSRDATQVTAAQLQTAVDQSFGAWTGVSTASLSTQFVGFTAIDPSVDSGQTVLGFESHPELDRVLGSTSWELDSVSGVPRAAHIFLNTTFPWSVATPGQPATQTTAGRFDVRSVATHEIGHLFGLGHSALGETKLDAASGGRSILGKAAVMFPIAFPPGTTFDRTLTPDDVAGISDIYGTSAFRQQLGQVSGKVTLGGAGLFGAHVYAFSQKTGAIVGGFTLDNAGSFVISGLTPGLYLVRAEPLDDADLDSFFDTTTVVNINFKPAYYPKIVAVPAGGSSGAIEIKVTSK
jgi:hypothetical protein